MKIGSIFLGNRRTVKPLFVGSYGNELTRGIYAMQIDVNNGEILKKSHFKSQGNPVSMVRRDRFVYICYKNHTGAHTDGGVAQYAAMEMQFGLTSRATNEGKTYHHFFMNNEGTYGYAVDYYNGEVITCYVYKKKITKVLHSIQHTGSGPVEKRQDSPHPCYINQTPDSKRIFVCDLGTDEVVLYSENEDGTLTRDNENSFKVKPGSGPRKMIFSKDGRYAYLLNELSSTVCIYKYEDCQFTFLKELDTYYKEDYEHPSYGGDIITTKNGKYLFVSNKGYDSVRLYEVNQETGELKFIEDIDTDENPTALWLINDRWLVIAAQKGGSLETFEIKEGERKGVLFETHFSYMLPEPVCIVDGNNLGERE